MGVLLSREALYAVVNELKNGGLRVVFTNGCFDLLHAGHIRYLKDAKAFGDILVVGLNSDLSVSRLKPHRPIIPQGQRAEILTAISYVDYVTIFDEDTPYELIRSLRPDVLVKGGDWAINEIVGSDLVSETRSIRYHEGLSTTKIIEKIKRLYCP